MEKNLPATALAHPEFAGVTHAQYFVRLPAGHVFEDLFAPRYWAHFYRRLRVNDLVRVKANDDSFDFLLSVRSVAQGGIDVEIWPKFPAGSGAEAAAAAGKEASVMRQNVVPVVRGQVGVRIESVGSRYRVIGLDQTSVSDHGSEREATLARDLYLDKLRLRLPTPEELSAGLAAYDTAETERMAKIDAINEKRRAARR